MVETINRDLLDNGRYVIVHISKPSIYFVDNKTIYRGEFILETDNIEFTKIDWFDYVVERLSEDKEQLKEIVEVLCVDDDTRELLNKYNVFSEDNDDDFDEIEKETGE